MRLIEEISAASNRQSPVSLADKVSNDEKFVLLQKILFDRYGIFLERKRGEFSDGIAEGYIKRGHVLDRNLFMRVYLASAGRLTSARKRKIFADTAVTSEQLVDLAALDRFSVALELFWALRPIGIEGSRATRYRDTLGQVFLALELTDPMERIDIRASRALKFFDLVVMGVAQQGRHRTRMFDKSARAYREVFSHDVWMSSGQFQDDIISYVKYGHVLQTGRKRLATVDFSLSAEDNRETIDALEAMPVDPGSEL